MSNQAKVRGPSSQALPLQEGEIHVWCADLNVPVETLRSLRSVLSPDEAARAERFYFDPDRNRFIATRSILRVLLSRYLGVLPQSIQFSYGEHGKPFLKEDTYTHVRFNVSHSHQKAVLAFTKVYDVGVDVEFLRPERATDELANRFFASPETCALRALPPDLRLAGFFACWTRKEAFIKAKGRGLSLSLSSFVVSLDPRDSARLISVNSDSLEGSRWHLENLEVGPDYRAAVAAESVPMKVELHQWEWNKISF